MKRTALLLMTIASFASAQQQQSDKPLEETKKNIKVLRGVPSSQLIPIMTVMANSLGVSCAYCHEAQWESDAKPPKEAARRMLTMTRAINATHYQSKVVVTCHTCHQGHVSVDAAPHVADAGWNKPQPPSHVSPLLPSAEELFERHLRSWGSAAAIKNRLSRGVATGRSGRGDPRSAPFEMFQQLPETVDLKVDLSYPPEANREFVSQFFNAMKIRERYSTVDTIDVRTLRDRDAYIVEAQPKEGGPAERLWFDSSTGLLLRRERTRPTIVGPLPEEYDFDDYRSIDGVMMPFFMQWSRGDYQITHRFAEAKHNVARQAESGGALRQ